MMVNKAKANLTDVVRFSQSVAQLRDYSNKLDRGIVCLEKICDQITEIQGRLQIQADYLESAQSMLAARINNINDERDKLNEEVSDLESELSDLEDTSADISRSINENDEDEDNDSDENDEIRSGLESNYKETQDNIEETKGEIESKNERVQQLNTELGIINSVNSKLESHLMLVNKTVYSLNEKYRSGLQLKSEMEKLQSDNQAQCSSASDSLSRIKSIIERYLHIKMAYENAAVIDTETHVGPNTNFSNGNTIPHPEHVSVKKTGIYKDTVSKEDIIRHRIIFNDEGRAISYDGKSFGGKYNSYDVRLNRTSLDNSIFGRYEGDRGESKFIPSDRTVEGINVKKILSKYGQDGIAYINAEPDFEVCAEAVVKISNMTLNRLNYIGANGNTLLGNFSQADIKLSEKWNLERRENRTDWKPEDIFNYRRKNKLTWHEKCDTETMVLVPFEINDYFKHSGGCSECRARDVLSDDGGGFDE